MRGGDTYYRLEGGIDVSGILLGVSFGALIEHENDLATCGPHTGKVQKLGVTKKRGVQSCVARVWLMTLSVAVIL
jgi:hypothetical protein